AKLTTYRTRKRKSIPFQGH
ncbi:hypothetical protein D046_2447B, partial [Vibrio parahaemolyticus V-223/04]